MYKIAAYLTVYQDLGSAQSCINALKQQTYLIESIYIIDNSPKSLIVTDYSQKIIVDYHTENIGIATKWAIEKNYDFLWTFDQDSEPASDALEKLIENYDKLKQQDTKIGIITPLVIDFQSDRELEGAIFYKYKFLPVSSFENNNPRKFYQKEFYQCDIVITSGSLVNLKAAKNVEFPNEGLFIDAVYWDYCMNFINKNYQIVVVTIAFLKHNFGNFKKNQNIGINKIPIYTYSALRYYYICRNHTFIESYLSKKTNYFHMTILYKLHSLAKKIYKILIYETEYKLLKIWACIRGTCDGFMGNLGKTW